MLAKVNCDMAKVFRNVTENNIARETVMVEVQLSHISGKGFDTYRTREIVVFERERFERPWKVGEFQRPNQLVLAYVDERHGRREIREGDLPAEVVAKCIENFHALWQLRQVDGPGKLVVINIECLHDWGKRRQVQ
uniref:Uncharacterized protein n=1 Tax=Paramoeba aestuarina TaxID=180227 RepID=A0A7S4NYS6_9EUKA|mmetsp:Transcript_31715/g.49594  ORF Transcript_31715/g.49594 Transcript_31715/m.49594 type:complete len:136 (+) Transcript_31715:30-437(+)